MHALDWPHLLLAVSVAVRQERQEGAWPWLAREAVGETDPDPDSSFKPAHSELQGREETVSDPAVLVAGCCLGSADQLGLVTQGED